MVFLFAGIVGTIIGIVVLILSVYSRKKYESKNMRCTAVTDGTVVRFVKKEFVESSRDGSSSYIESYCYPIYEYFVDGERFEVQGNNGKREVDDTLIGLQKQVFYNPDNCYECYVSGEDLRSAYIIIAIVGIVFLVAGIGSLLGFFLQMLF